MGGQLVSDAAADGLLGQILQEVQATRAEVTALKVSTAQLVSDARHREKQVDDHEDRIRALEAAALQDDVDAAAFVTKADLAESDRNRTARFRWLLTASLTVFGLVETAVIALIVKG